MTQKEIRFNHNKEVEFFPDCPAKVSRTKVRVLIVKQLSLERTKENHYKDKRI
jgi:hypothetical protein